MRLGFELKKIVQSPLYCLFLLLMLGLSVVSFYQASDAQDQYVQAYSKELSDLETVLVNLDLPDESEDQARLTGLRSDLETIRQDLQQQKFDSIPETRELFYQDLAYFVEAYPAVFASYHSLTREDVSQLTTWNDWLLAHGLPDEPVEAGWSLGRLLQARVEAWFGLTMVLMTGGLLVFSQIGERRAGYRRWQLVQADTLTLQYMRRLSAAWLAIMGAGLTSLLLTTLLALLTNGWDWESLTAPVSLFGQTQLWPVWSYVAVLIVSWSLVMWTLGLLFSLVGHLAKSTAAFVALAGLLLLFVSYQTTPSNDWLSHLLPIFSYPLALALQSWREAFLHLDLYALGAILLFCGAYLAIEKWSLGLSAPYQKEEATPTRLTGWSFEILQLTRSSFWFHSTLLLVLTAFLFSAVTTIQKQQVVKEEQERLATITQFYQEDEGSEAALQAEIARLQELVASDSSYQEQLDLLLQAQRDNTLYKELMLKQEELFETDQVALSAFYRDYLQTAQEGWLAQEEAVFASDGIGATGTLENLRRYQTRYQLSHYYWQELAEEGVPAGKRGAELVLPLVENRFETSDVVVPVEEEGWDQSRDFSALGALRSLVDGPFYFVLLMVAVWLGGRGKAAAVEQGTWKLYQTQPGNLKQVLIRKWLLGLGLALGFTSLLFLAVFVVNFFIGGLGYWQDGVLLLSQTEKGELLRYLQGEDLWVWFLSNSVYLPMMFVGLLALEAVLISLLHLVQVYLPKQILSYSLVLLLAAGLLSLVMGIGAWGGLDLLRHLFLFGV